MKIPYGTRYLIINCFNKKDQQFKGILNITRMLNRIKKCYCAPWDGSIIDLSWRRVLIWVLLSGHGPENTAAMGDGKKQFLIPEKLLLSKNVKLYLLGCYQGKDELKEKWAKKSSINVKNVFGSVDETETALSLICLLNLLEKGVTKLDNVFKKWIDANDFFRPYFKRFRERYMDQITMI